MAAQSYRSPSAKLAAPTACALLLLLATCITPAAAHAYLKIPRSRGMLLATPGVYGPDGADYQWSAYNGRSSVCGDGGQAEKIAFGSRMAPEATYTPGSIATFTVRMRVVHWGRVEFRICRYTGPESTGLTQACIDSRVLQPASTSDPRYIGNFWYLGSSGVGDYTMQYLIPSDLSCDGVTSFCVLHMTYTTGNSCNPPGCTGGFCQGNLGPCTIDPIATNGEVFRNCIDITVGGSSISPSPPPSPLPPTPVTPSSPNVSPPPPPVTPTGSCCSTSVWSPRYNGLHQSPANCNQFCTCTNGNQIALQNCPVGLYFNEIISVCDWPANVQCPAP